MTLPDGIVVKWWSECGSLGDHFRAAHPTNNTNPGKDISHDEPLGADGKMGVEALCRDVEDNDVSNGAFARFLWQNFCQEDVYAHSSQF